VIEYSIVFSAVWSLCYDIDIAITITLSLVKIYTVSQKTSHLWFAITLTHMNIF